MNSRLQRILVVGTGSIALLVALVLMCAFTVSQDQYAVVTTFGKPGRVLDESGLYVKWPTPFSIANKMDRKLQPYETPLIEYLTGDKKNLLIKTFIFWRIEDPMLYFKAVNDQALAQQKLEDIVCSLVASTLGDHKINQLISTNRENLAMDEIIGEITAGSQERVSSYGIHIDFVGFSRLALPGDNTRSVYRRMIAERSAIANEYRAQGRQRAAEIRADADKQRSDILALAYRDSEIIHGEADAEAAAIYGDAYSKNPEFYKFLRTLESERNIMGNKTTIVLPMDSELFAPLESK